MSKTSVIFLFCFLFSASHFTASSFASTAQLALSPDNSLEFTLSVIRSAKISLQINMYQFDQPVITDAVIERIKSGVTVQLLIEGEPYGKISNDGKLTLQKIHDAMSMSSNSKNIIFIMTGVQTGGHRRFVYDHAKYMVIDSMRAWVSSDNLTLSGHPSAGTIGDRGWEIAIDDLSIVRQLQDMFKSDTDLSFHDVLVIKPSDPLPKKFVRGGPLAAAPAIKRTTNVLFPIGLAQVANAELITSPNATALFQLFVRSARAQIDFEFMSLPGIWKPSAGVKIENPMITELILAAKRGVKVRVLLNDDRVFNPGGSPNIPVDNEITASYLNEQARINHIPITVKIVDTKKAGIAYIHNKGIMIDGKRVLVSSINGTRNSVINNRELGLIIDSVEAAQYFGKAFDFDWQFSKKN